MRDKAKPVVPRQAASKDIAEAVDHLAREAGLDAALRFIDALEVAYLHISTQPASGSPWIDSAPWRGVRTPTFGKVQI